jgi:N-6 DNA Methylase
MPSDDRARSAWLSEIRRLASSGERPTDLVTSVAIGIDPSFPERGLRLGGRRVDVPPPPAGAGPDLLGGAYEATIAPRRRRRTGAHYTPPTLARRLSEIALEGLIDEGAGVCDPACGGGAFLLAAGKVFEATGMPRRQIVEGRLWGIDVDPLAVAVTEAALYLWSGEVPGAHVVVGDALTDSWPATGFAAVVGNPPFLSQLGESTARPGEMSTRLRGRFGDVIAPYTDTAWIFLLAAVESVRPGCRVVLIQPQSVLSARDAAGIRRVLPLEGLWLTDRPVFAASVRVCAPVVRRSEHPHRTVRRWAGTEVTEIPSVSGFGEDEAAGGIGWAELAAGIIGVPDVELSEDRRRLGDLATATAGFRDEFYGLADFVVEGGDGVLPQLITSGIIEPGRVAWGERPLRFAGRRWLAPRVDIAALRARGQPRIARWVDDRLVPKVVVATQSRVVEAAVDRDGTWVPATPVISVTAPADRLDHVAAALLAPPVTAIALRRFAGAALATGAVKLAARQVLDLPIPEPGRDWDAAARLVAGLPAIDDPDEHEAVLLAAGERMIAAYGLDEQGDELLEWWAARLRA